MDTPRVYDLTQRSVVLGLGRSAASWLQSNYESSVQFWGKFCFALCPSIALPCCDSMTTRWCFLCGWPLSETLGVFADWCTYPESSILASFYSLCSKMRLSRGCPSLTNVTNPGTGINSTAHGWPRRQLHFPLIKGDAPSCFLRNSIRCLSHPTLIKPCQASCAKAWLELFLVWKKKNHIYSGTQFFLIGPRWDVLVSLLSFHNKSL